MDSAQESVRTAAPSVTCTPAQPWGGAPPRLVLSGDFVKPLELFSSLYFGPKFQFCKPGNLHTYFSSRSLLNEETKIG